MSDFNQFRQSNKGYETKNSFKQSNPYSNNYAMPKTLTKNLDRTKRNRKKQLSMGFAGNLVMGSSNGFSANYKNDFKAYDSSNSPKQKYNETKFRSTFHNTVSGKFMDLPPLSDRHVNNSKDFGQSTRSSFNDASNSKSRSRKKKKTENQTGTNFYSNRNKLPDLVAMRQSKERPKNRGRAN